MKKVFAFFCRLTLLFFLIGGVSLAAPVTAVLKQNTALAIPYGAGTITYQYYGTSFMGSLTVSHLHVGTTYQMKLEGQPDDDLVGNDNLGSIGRWWVIDPLDPSGWGGRNTTDGGVQAERDAGFTVLGYILFDSFTYTGRSMTISFYLDSS
ncbi:MAG: hypothetical protein JRF20_06610, partial [Deltaproteobacteria bacterium]|nr:hypothetical protein [Deltaproteobacteria bacterium]